MATPRVLISILNWNKAEITLQCLASLENLERQSMTVDILVLDNGSHEADYEKLCAGVHGGRLQIQRSDVNLGFTGGHNVALKKAIVENYDFVWMLNNDTTVQRDTLARLVTAISADDQCGAVSPVIMPDDGGVPENAWGLVHDWRERNARWMQSEAASRVMHRERPHDICLSGTANLLRVQAICEIGLLDERLFAYYDDNDIGARLGHAGWRCQVVFDAVALHSAPPQTVRPLYFFYLMFRNEMIFWNSNMPVAFRKLLWLKLVNQSLFRINHLRRQGLSQQADSALLGVWDFICKRHGAPRLGCKAPLLLRAALGLSGRLHARQLSMGDTVARSPSVEKKLH